MIVNIVNILTLPHNTICGGCNPTSLMSTSWH